MGRVDSKVLSNFVATPNHEMYGQPLTREHGAPLRLSIPTKIGYKQAKYLTDLKVSHVLEKVGYWEDQGYSEFYGL